MSCSQRSPCLDVVIRWEMADTRMPQSTSEIRVLCQHVITHVTIPKTGEQRHIQDSSVVCISVASNTSHLLSRRILHASLATFCSKRIVLILGITHGFLLQLVFGYLSCEHDMYC